MRTNWDASQLVDIWWCWCISFAFKGPESVMGNLSAYGFSWEVGKAWYNLDWLWTVFVAICYSTVLRFTSDFETSLGDDYDDAAICRSLMSVFDFFQNLPLYYEVWTQFWLFLWTIIAFFGWQSGRRGLSCWFWLCHMCLAAYGSSITGQILGQTITGGWWQQIHLKYGS